MNILLAKKMGNLSYTLTLRGEGETSEKDGTSPSFSGEIRDGSDLPFFSFLYIRKSKEVPSSRKVAPVSVGEELFGRTAATSPLFAEDQGIPRNGNII